MSRGWIGVDLDGTLAEYHGWKGEHHIGAPIPVMLERVKAWLTEGRSVRIFTARVAGFAGPKARPVIEEWCKIHIGKVLPVTCVKDQQCVEIWDDRAIQIIPNTGTRADGL